MAEEANEDQLKFQSMTITRATVNEQFGVELNDEEWKRFCYYAKKSWVGHSDELRAMVLRHMRVGLTSVGYSPTLEDGELRLRKR